MTIDEACNKIEDCHGFDDATSVVGEAWERVKVEIATLHSQLTASQELERILREGLGEYAQTRNWAHTEMNSPYRNLWMQWSSGYDIAAATLKAAEEVK